MKPLKPNYPTDISPEVSVVMAVFNGAEFLEDAVESILCQTYCNFEFIIINDGSKDDTSAILERLATHDSRIRIVTKERQGLTVSLNLGIRLARGKYIARMDADDISMPDRLSKQVNWLEEHPNVGVLGGAVRFFGVDGRSGIDSVLETSPNNIKKVLNKFCPLVHPAVMFRKSVIVQLGGYRPCFTVAQDYDLWLRVAEHADLANLSDIVLWYRVHEQQISIKKINEQALCWFTARASAEMRTNKKEDFVSALEKISFDALVQCGFPALSIQKSVFRFIVRTITNLVANGLISNARLVMEEVFNENTQEKYYYLTTAHRAWCEGYIDHFNKNWGGAASKIALAILLRPAYGWWIVSAIYRKAWRYTSTLNNSRE